MKDTTCRIGCGFANCGGTRTYVCNYATGQHDFHTPFVPGSPCAACPNKCSNDLCGKLTVLIIAYYVNYASTPVYQSFCSEGGGCLPQYMMGYTPQADTPQGRHPPGRHPLPKQMATASDGTHPTLILSCIPSKIYSVSNTSHTLICIESHVTKFKFLSKEWSMTLFEFSELSELRELN